MASHRRSWTLVPHDKLRFHRIFILINIRMIESIPLKLQNLKKKVFSECGSISRTKNVFFAIFIFHVNLIVKLNICLPKVLCDMWHHLNNHTLNRIKTGLFGKENQVDFLKKTKTWLSVKLFGIVAEAFALTLFVFWFFFLNFFFIFAMVTSVPKNLTFTRSQWLLGISNLHPLPLALASEKKHLYKQKGCVQFSF